MSIEKKMKILETLQEKNSRLPEEIKEAEEVRSRLNNELKEMDKSDARENVPYQTKLEEVARINATLRKLNERELAWKNFSTFSNESDNILIGSGVRLLDVKRNIEYYFVIVQKELSDAVNGALAITTPVGRSIHRKREGDEVEVSAPSGIITYRIQEVN